MDLFVHVPTQTFPPPAPPAHSEQGKAATMLSILRKARLKDKEMRILML